MKTTKFFFFGLFFILISGSVFGQSITYSSAESLFNDEQVRILEKAEKFIDRAENNISDAAQIESKYEKFRSKKKEKFDKKTAEAKKLRIEAERNYLKAYQDASEVYSKIIVGATFYDDNDKNEALALNDDAMTLIEDADKKMSTYNKEIMNPKGLKAMSSSSLNSAISTARNLKESAYSKQKEALDFVLNQDRKKEQTERDNRAWQSAQDINTIEAYQDYIDNYSSGKYVERARQMIRTLEAQKLKEKTPNITGYTFKVQIAASKKQLSDYELSLRYKRTKEIESVYAKRNYKYRVGEFTNYADAAKFRDNFKSTCPDSFIVVFDKNGIQVEVTDKMKGM